VKKFQESVRIPYHFLVSGKQRQLESTNKILTFKYRNHLKTGQNEQWYSNGRKIHFLDALSKQLYVFGLPVQNLMAVPPFGMKGLCHLINGSVFKL
jgi:hypothetical protein